MSLVLFNHVCTPSSPFPSPIPKQDICYHSLSSRGSGTIADEELERLQDEPEAMDDYKETVSHTQEGSCTLAKLTVVGTA